MGIGRMWSPKTGWGNAKDVLEENGLSTIVYKPKEVRRKCSRVQSIDHLNTGFNHDQWNAVYYSAWR
jgi:hypothetical protein